MSINSPLKTSTDPLKEIKMVKTDTKKVQSQIFFLLLPLVQLPNFLWKKKFPLHNPFKVLKKKFLDDLFGHVLTILALIKCRLVTKHVLSRHITIHAFVLLFHLDFIYTKKLSINDYLLLIYTFMCIIIFLYGTTGSRKIVIWMRFGPF